MNRGRVSFLIALLGAACGPPRIAKPPGGGGPGGGSGAGVSDASGPPPAFNLPDAGPAPAARDAAAIPTAPAGTACVGVAQEAESGPVDLLLLMDSSGSMGSGAFNGRSRWELAQAAIMGFIRDPNSRGLGVGLQFFPVYVTRPCSSDQDCSGVADYCRGQDACPSANPLKPGPACKAAGDPVPTICPGRATCVATGACSASGAVCSNVGQACPGQAGTCQAFPRTCFGHNQFPSACKLETYRDPAVAIAALPDSQGPLLDALNSHFPDGATPMEPAARGALAYLAEHRLANPGRRAALVMVTDGTPSMGCADNNIPGTAATLARGLAGPPIVRTYVIGMFSEAEVPMVSMEMDQLASAGGTDKAIVLAANNDFTGQLQQALNQVRGSLGCEYTIPKPPNGGLIDFGKVNVHYTSGAASEDIPYVESRDHCDPARGGWFYDVNPASGVPTRIVTCDATCTRLKATEMGKVDVVFGCGTRGID